MPRILLVEDNRLLSGQVAGLLAEAGYWLEWANSVSAARLLLDCQPFQGVILDHDLPDASGLQVCSHSAIRRHGCPVWVMSGESESRLQAARQWPGVVAVLAKPVTAAHLLELLSSHLRQQAAERYPRLISPEERQWLLAGPDRVDTHG